MSFFNLTPNFESQKKLISYKGSFLDILHSEKRLEPTLFLIFANNGHLQMEINKILRIQPFHDLFRFQV